ncbi:MAG: aldolase/citrate lyase family protein [Chloroflexota bacterium]
MAGEENLKERIRSGKPTIGLITPMTADKARLEGMLDGGDYQFVSVDSQHGPFNEERLVEFCTAAQELGMPVHFRIKHTRHTYLIGNLLDLGPSMIEAPQVEQEDTVHEAVDNFYYRPVGKRSWGGTSRLGLSERPGLREYADWWNGYGVLWMQVESIQAISNIPRLVQPGVDCVSWGPADLSFDREANPHHPLAKSDDACVEYAAKLLEGLDAKLAIRHYDKSLRQKYLDMGATVLLERPS